MKIAIIGAGWAGLAAAVELASAGTGNGIAGITVFEASRQPGGRARSVDVRGLTLDNGQHLLIGAYRETLRLMHRIGANPELLLKRLPLELNFPGNSPAFRLRLPHLPPPLHLACGLLTARGVSLREKIGAVRFMRALQAHHYRLDNDSTVADLLDRHGQHGHLRQSMWEALCLAALNTEAAHASAQIFANVLRDSLGGDRADTDLLLPARDLASLLPEPAIAFIRRQGGEIRLATRIEGIGVKKTPQGKFTFGHGEFDQIILATAPQHAARLLAPLAETRRVAGQLLKYSYEPIGTVYAAYPAKVRLPFPMLGLDSGRGLGQWVVDRGACGGLPGLLSFVLSAHGAWEQYDNAALACILHAELEHLLQEKLPQARWHQVIRERRATFSCRPQLFRPDCQTAIAGLWLAGDYVCADYPATLEGAVRSGIQAARCALAACRA